MFTLEDAVAIVKPHHDKIVAESEMREMRRKYMALYRALERALDHLEELVKDTNSEPTFGDHYAITAAQEALFANRPLADWEEEAR